MSALDSGLGSGLGAGGGSALSSDRAAVRSQRPSTEGSEIPRPAFAGILAPPKDEITRAAASRPPTGSGVISTSIAEELALPPRAVSRRSSKGSSEASETSGTAAAASGAAASGTAARSEAVARTSRKHNRPLPKTAARNRIKGPEGLQKWEEDSNSDREQVKDPQPPSSPQGAGPSEQEVSERMMTEVPAEPLKSYYSRLNLVRHHKRKKAALPSKSEDSGALAALGDGSPTSGDGSPHVAQAPAENSSSEGSDQESMADTSKIRLPTSESWCASNNNGWIPGNECGRLVGEGDVVFASFQSPSTREDRFTDFDVEAEIMLEDKQPPAFAGLCFRMEYPNQQGRAPREPRSYYAMFLSVESKRIECWEYSERGKGQCVCDAPSGLERHVLGEWHKFRVRAVDQSFLLYFNKKQVGHFTSDYAKDLIRSGYVGLYVGSVGRLMDSKFAKGSRALFAAKIRNIVVTDLRSYVESLSKAQIELDDQHKRLSHQDGERIKQAEIEQRQAKFIQDIVRGKLSFIRQRMQVYMQAKNQARDSKARSRKLLTWMALLLVFHKLDKTMHDEKIWKIKTKRWLDHLQEKAPPPPPPPDEEPPSAADEELHDRYEARRLIFKQQWKDAGHKQLGKEKFEKIKYLEHGPAEKEKIARIYYERAQHMASREEKRKCLKDAFCLMNDDPDREFEDWEAEFEAQAPRSTRSRFQI